MGWWKHLDQTMARGQLWVKRARRSPLQLCLRPRARREVVEVVVVVVEEGGLLTKYDGERLGHGKESKGMQPPPQLLYIQQVWPMTHSFHLFFSFTPKAPPLAFFCNTEGNSFTDLESLTFELRFREC